VVLHAFHTSSSPDHLAVWIVFGIGIGIAALIAARIFR
jgi:hypothetical protein